MLIDITVENFRSFETETLFSLNVESSRNRLSDNFKEVENGKLSVLKSAAVFGPNASGKSNLLKAIQALRWLICHSHKLQEEGSIPAYEPFRLSESSMNSEVKFETEFVVPSGMRYQYQISFARDKVVTESLHSFPGRQRALVFERRPDDTWETIKFGGTYKGGSRRIPFFRSNSYLSKAGNDASAPDSIREIVRYFRSIASVSAGQKLWVSNYFDQAGHLETVSEIICLADTGIQKVTSEKRKGGEDIRLPADMPEHIKEAILSENENEFKFWMQSKTGKLIPFREDDVSDGTLKLFEVLPFLLTALSTGAPVLIDELDGHLHTSLVAMVLQLFHDPFVNERGAQLIFTTHDTNIMSPSILRRDQIWMTSKDQGVTSLASLDEYDKNFVRPDSPFEAFYLDGRFGSLPNVFYAKIRDHLQSSNLGKGYIED